MKWIRKDYKGNPQVWYSGDVIEECKKTLNYIQTAAKTYEPFVNRMIIEKCKEMLKLIESEE